LRLSFKLVRKYILDKSSKQYSKNIKQLKFIRLYINKFSRSYPWKYKCYEQALTARLILNHYNTKNTLVLGCRTIDSVTDFHAWTYSNDIVITGNYELETYIVINKFH